MASNKWLSDLQLLKSTTNTLREHLRDGGVAAYDNDTLQTLVGKVPNLAPIEMTDKWQPDPLWKFPDPNGSGELKTIREIYDEDTMASSYTYRGIYQIIGEYDTIDLKKALNSRTYSDTFVLSDGTVYEKITANKLEHTWDKSKDVIDSKGRPMRYVRVYSGTAVGYLLAFDRTTIWCIHNLDSSSATQITESQYMPCECIEFGSIKSTFGSLMLPYSLQKIVIDGSAFTNTSIPSYPYKLKELEIKSAKQINMSVSSNQYGLTFARFKELKVEDPSKYTNNTVSIKGMSFVYPIYINNIDLSNLPSKVTTCTLQYLSADTISLPQGATNITCSSIINCKELIIPETTTSLTVGSCHNVEKLTVLGNPNTVSISSNSNLKELILPFNFNATGINLSSSPYMEHESLVNILNNLTDLTGQSAKTITFGATNLAKLTDEEKAIATNKNWTLS